MVDYLSKYRMYNSGYTMPAIRDPIRSYRDLYRDRGQHMFTTQRTPIHDCRTDKVQQNADNKLFDAWVLSHGLNDTYSSINRLYTKPAESTGKPDKLLFDTSGDLRWPRGLTTNAESDIIIADTMNYRVLVFNNYAILKYKFGSKGVAKGQFNEPTGVATFPNDNIVVADKKNKRFQVFSPSGQFRYMIPTIDEPYSVSTDSEYNVAIATAQGTIEIYRQEGKLVNKFKVGAKVPANSLNGIPLSVCLLDRQELVLSDPTTRSVKYFNFSGDLLYKFTPEATEQALSVIPTGLTVTPIGQIILADALNHTVNVYSERGVLLLQLLGPTDDLGAVQTVAVGVEGHLICTEYSSNGAHTLKIFRYRDCACHRHRPGSSKRSTPTRLL